ncbi:MAG: NAD(P)H-quinone oxidoreductase [Myxococcota bacterium]
MHAFVVEDGGALVWKDVPTPEPGPGEVRIRVTAAGLNRADLLQRKGFYPPPPGASPYLGLECSGTIEALGPGVDGVALGDPVCALLAGGGYAEFVVCPIGQVLPVPDGVSLADAAGLPEVWATTWMVLEQQARFTPGSSVLVHGAGGGVGLTLVQWIRIRQGRSFAIAGDEAKLARCRELGASGTANRHEGPWRPAVQAWAPEGVDVVVDPVGASALADHQQILAVGGRVVVIGLLGGREATLDFGRLLVKRQSIIGTVLRARPVHEKAEIVQQLQREVWPRIASGDLDVGVTRVVPRDEADAAHQAMATNATTGKWVIRL